MPATLLLGELACLAASLCWAVAVALFRRPIAAEGAISVNFAKNTIATFLLGTTALLLGQLAALITAPATLVGALVLSGLLGLTLGDSALFLAVQRIGAHRALLFQTLAPIFAAIFSFLLTGELITLRQSAGVLLVLAGVAVVVAPARGEEKTPMPWAGMAFAATSAFGQGSGIALTKTAMAVVPIFAASFVRQASAVAGLVLVLALQRRLRHSVTIFGAPQRLMPILVPAVLSAYIGFSLMMTGISRAPASVAAVLLAVSPVFSLFLDAAGGHAKITWRGLLGTLVAVSGVAVLVAS